MACNVVWLALIHLSCNIIANVLMPHVLSIFSILYIRSLMASHYKFVPLNTIPLIPLPSLGNIHFSVLQLF